jgi:hypothetical protein
MVTQMNGPCGALFAPLGGTVQPSQGRGDASDIGVDNRNIVRFRGNVKYLILGNRSSFSGSHGPNFQDFSGPKFGSLPVSAPNWVPWSELPGSARVRLGSRLSRGRAEADPPAYPAGSFQLKPDNHGF